MDTNPASVAASEQERGSNMASPIRKLIVTTSNGDFAHTEEIEVLCEKVTIDDKGNLIASDGDLIIAGFRAAYWDYFTFGKGEQDEC